MKFYYVVNARMPNEKAHGIQIAKMCEAFVKEGVELELIVPNRKTTPENIQEFYGLRVPVPVKKLPVIDFYNGGPVAFFLSSITFMVSYFFYLLWQRARGKRGIIYTIDMDIFSFALVPFLGMPYFTEMHGAKKRSLPYNLFFSGISGIISTNSITGDELKTTFNIPTGVIVVEPNGIDLKQFSVNILKHDARKRLNLPQDEKIVLYVGRAYRWKGLEILTETAKLMEKDTEIYFLGSGKDELEKIIGESINGLIHAVGGRPQNEIPIWLRAADAVLAIGTKKNNDSYLYTSPMKIFEYLASGSPIIASNPPAIREILSEKEAIFYAPDNAQDLADKILYTMEHPSIGNELAKHGRERAELFSWENRARRIISFINLQTAK